MFRNYLITALRNLKRSKIYTALNVFGLALGIGCGIVLYKIIVYETSFDNFQSNGDRVVRIVNQFTYAGSEIKSPNVPSPTARALRNDFPDLEAVAMINYIQGGNQQISFADKSGKVEIFSEEKLAFAENDLFSIIDFEWIVGDPESALINPKTVVISRSTAFKYYGITEGYGSVLGNVVNLGNTHDLTIVGVIEDQPKNTNFPFEIIVHFYDLEGYNPYFRENGWETTNGGTECYLLLPEQLSLKDMNRRLPDFLDKYNKKEDKFSYNFRVQPLSTIHSDSDYGNYTGRTVPPPMIMALSTIGIFLIVIACVNFVNLSTAQAVRRTKEIGVRKVMGGLRSQLRWQFIGETMIISLLSMIIALGVAEILLVNLEEILGYRLFLGLFDDPGTASFLLATTLLVGFISGTYPAFLLSRLNPVLALNSRIQGMQSGGSMKVRRALVIFQFIISQAFIMCTIIVMSQIDFFANKDLGFNRENVVIGYIPEIDSLKNEQLRSHLLSDARVQKVSFSLGAPTAATNNTNVFSYLPSGNDNQYNVNVKDIDLEYMELYDLNLLAGRNLRAADRQKNIIVNEELIRTMGIYDPNDVLGEQISLYSSDYTIVGVVKDFHIYSLHRKISPMLLRYNPRLFYTAAVKLKSNSDDITFIEDAWKATYPEYVPLVRRLDEQLQRSYRQEQVVGGLFEIFATIAILISCLGLYGLISFMANLKTKEIGIRKVLGASVLNILNIFSRELVFLLIVASAVAIPIAYLFIKDWLADFTFSISIGPGLILKGFFVSLAIALLTMSYQSIRASLANPVEALKDE